jgi:hypothetical protein
MGTPNPQPHSWTQDGTQGALLRQRSNRFQGESADKDKCESPAWKLVMNARDFINLLVAGAENLDWVEICGRTCSAAERFWWALDYYQVLRI